MSNPIADTADYFNRYNKQQQYQQQFEELPRHIPERPWTRVLDRISFLIPPAYFHGDDDSVYNDRDTFELMKSKASSEDTTLDEAYSSSTAKSIIDIKPGEEEERLPSAADLSKAMTPEKETSDYFTHPFPEQQHQHQQENRRDISDYYRTVAPPEEGRIKDKWDRTIDKLKFIANLTSHQPVVVQPILGPSHTLATYYPPAFDPVFTAFARDEYGRKLPPILLQCIYATVTDSEYVDGINQWVFRVELQYGDVKWVIRRNIADFMALHFKLKVKSNLYDYVPDPPNFPNQLSNLLDTAKSTIGLFESKQTNYNRRATLTNYLRSLLLRAHVTASYDICEFLELSAISIAHDMGWKGKEGYLKNRIRHVAPKCFCISRITKRWTTEWIILRDSYMAFSKDAASSEPTDVLLFDSSLRFEVLEPRVYLGNYHIKIRNQSREIEIKGTKREIDQWIDSIEKVKSESPWVYHHRFASFAPIRHNAKVKWFVDAENHFNAVAEAILSAKVEIYIADWWLSPELYLRRPPEENEDFRLDRLLKRKAIEGVKIYVVVYKEMSLALTIDSVHTKQTLQNLHPNIIVQRHPDHSLGKNDTVLFWSHHEKIVVVDNRLAFIGGLDLCFGRYDTHAHSLSDFPAEGHDREVFPGQDYSNPRVKDFINVAQYDRTLVNRATTPRMPWHDVTLGVVGPIARDISRHFIQRWNFLKTTKSMHRRAVPFLMPKGEYVAARDESKFSGTCKVQLLRSSSRWSSDIEREHSIYNAYMECITHAKHFIYIENQFFISTTTEDKLLRNKIAEALVSRIKRAHDKGEKFRVFIIMPLIPAFEGDLASSEAYSARNVMHFQYTTISRGGHSIMEKLRQYGIDPDQYINWFSLRNYAKLKVPPRAENPFDDLNRVPTNQTSSSPPRRKSYPTMDDRYSYVTEILYIHSKLMIVDDRIVLMGSANINDRSQLGNRDSEVAMLVEDTEMVQSYMNGKEYQAAKFAHTLRMQLWKEHLGLLNFERWSDLLKGTVEREVNELGISRHLTIYPSL
ncbi:Phospholipase D1, partial [Rhizopus azygosporus]